MYIYTHPTHTHTQCSNCRKITGGRGPWRAQMSLRTFQVNAKLYQN